MSKLSMKTPKLDLTSTINKYIDSFIKEKFSERLEKLEKRISFIQQRSHRLAQRSELWPHKMGLQTVEQSELLAKKIEALDLSVRATSCLQNQQIKTIGDLVSHTEWDLLRSRGFGRKSLNEIKDVMDELGLKFRLEDEENP